ncbi:hypothetical protein [Rhizobium sp. L1K21]|uniref:hypothetical protein n=1 Tax=Rhizobium sp. L1K21 TaxID=2954933 RepID=UPI002091FF29|nr:hypothetical protein [Rhizobium sp. L1K21]MCO6184961.1 hypothetical protein [Rhizobium sp. L1K21]
MEFKPEIEVNQMPLGEANTAPPLKILRKNFSGTPVFQKWKTLFHQMAFDEENAENFSKK